MSEGYTEKNSRSISGVIAAILFLVYAAMIAGIFYQEGLSVNGWDEETVIAAEAVLALCYGILLLLGRKSQIWSILMLLQIFADWFYASFVFESDLYLRFFRMAPWGAFLIWFYMIIDSETKESLPGLKSIRWLPGILCIANMIYGAYVIFSEIYRGLTYEYLAYTKEDIYYIVIYAVLLIILQPLAGIFMNQWLNRVMNEEIEALEEHTDISELLLRDFDDQTVIIRDPGRNAGIGFVILAAIEIAAALWTGNYLYIASGAVTVMLGILFLRRKRNTALAAAMCGCMLCSFTAILRPVSMLYFQGRAIRLLEVAAYTWMFILVSELLPAGMNKNKGKKQMQRVREHAFYPAITESIYAVYIIVYSVNNLVKYGSYFTMLRGMCVIAEAAAAMFAIWMACFWIREQAEFELQAYRAKQLRRDGTEVMAEFAEEVEVPDELLDAISEVSGQNGTEKSNVVDIAEYRSRKKRKPDGNH